MNNQQISQLKRMLKKYGIKNAESIVRGAIEFNYNRFLELAEPIYVVSRIQSCYTNQREVSMLDKANLEWVGLVVDGGWCGALLPYIEKYGATITKKAIQYLIENKMWDAYDGKTALKTKGANHYKGFEDIHAAAEYVKELEPPKDDTTETAETTKHDGDTEKASDEVSDLSEKAFEASETIKKLLTDAIGNFDIINEFIVMRCNTTKVENELKALQKTLEDKDNEIKGLQDLVASRNDEVSELKENNEKLNQDLYAQMERNDEVEKQLSELLEAAKTPIKKVVPESGLRQLPLVGDKMLRGLIPFLEKYNIVIDPNR
jgi:hypothetical protein|uniref:Uncharacterized protein n=1 Tax=Myoviridae sp. ctiX384 TaxID=2827702 RepID=A0A8S5TB73_9CAUD|nr:MAG TPA: hypothetical protein [Myoviridae sp. ctiX384]